MVIKLKSPSNYGNQSLNTQVLQDDTLVVSGNTKEYALGGVDRFAMQFVYDDTTPSAKAFATTDVNTTDDEITEVGHGFSDDLIVQFTTTGGLPAGLSLTTDYYVIVVDADTYQVSASAGGSAVVLTSQGTGTHTATPASLSGASALVQKSCDGINWVNVAAAANITVDGTHMVEESNIAYNFVRYTLAIAEGQLSFKVIIS